MTWERGTAVLPDLDLGTVEVATVSVADDFREFGFNQSRESESAAPPGPRVDVGSAAPQTQTAPAESSEEPSGRDGASLADERLAELAADYERRLAAQREALGGAIADRTAVAINEGLERLAKGLSDTLAALIEPLLAADIRKRTLAEIEALAGHVSATTGALDIRLRGPAGMAEQLQERLAARGLRVEVDGAGSPQEVALEINTLEIESRFADWADELQKGVTS